MFDKKDMRDIRRYNGVKEVTVVYKLKTWVKVVLTLAAIAAVVVLLWIVVCALFQRPGQPFSFSEAIELTRNFIFQIVNG